MECLPIKPITHIAGNACRLLWQHFFTVRMTTDAHRGNSECGAAVENYTRERDRDVDKKNQGAIVGLHLSRGGTQTKSNVPHCGHPRHASPLLLWSMRPEAWHTGTRDDWSTAFFCPTAFTVSRVLLCWRHGATTHYEDQDYGRSIWFLLRSGTGGKKKKGEKKKSLVRHSRC